MMCASKKKLTRNEVYDAIQATIACVSKESRAWILKHKNSDGGLYFGMNHKLDIGKRTINIRSELGGEPIKLISLIKKTEDDCLITYADIDFLPYPPNAIHRKRNSLTFS